MMHFSSSLICLDSFLGAWGSVLCLLWHHSVVSLCDLLFTSDVAFSTLLLDFLSCAQMVSCVTHFPPLKNIFIMAI